VGAGELLVPDHLADVVEPAAAVLLRPVDAGPTSVVERALPGEVELAHRLAVGRPLLGGQVFGEPRPGLVAEVLLLAGEVEVHRQPNVSDDPSESRIRRRRGSRWPWLTAVRARSPPR